MAVSFKFLLTYCLGIVLRFGWSKPKWLFVRLFHFSKIMHIYLSSFDLYTVWSVLYTLFSAVMMMPSHSLQCLEFLGTFLYAIKPGSSICSRPGWVLCVQKKISLKVEFRESGVDIYINRFATRRFIYSLTLSFSNIL